MLTDFLTWMLNEAARPYIPEGILTQYEQALKDELRNLIHRTRDPHLRARFEEMLTCPIRDSRGTCRSFTDYALSALIKNGIHERYDLEAALAYVFEKMLMDKLDAGGGRKTLFGSFEEKPGLVEGNPLQARFMVFLAYAIKNIRKGKIPRLANVERRPQGTVSIGLGRTKAGDDYEGVSPEAIPAHSSDDRSLNELIEDITTLLRKQEREAGLPLVQMFTGMMQGEKTDQLRRTYGDASARKGREIVLQTIEGYARSTGNLFLQSQVKMLRDRNPREKMPQRRSAPKSTAPKQEPGKESDFASIVSVIERLGRPANSSDLMKYRRRWVDYPPRTQEAGYKNRLEEVLSLAVREGVLRLLTGPGGGKVYDLGPNAERYRQAVGAGRSG